MFVSGPVGTSVIGSSEARIVSAMKSTACCATGSVVGAGSAGPSMPLSPWTYSATNGSRQSGRGRADGDRHVGAADELEQLQRVDRRLLERLVAVDGRDADELDLRAREREQERDRVVVAGVAVEEDLHGPSIVVYLARRSAARVARPGATRRARRQRRRGGAPRRAVAALEQRDEQAGGERVAGAGAVDGLDRRAAPRARSPPRPRAALRPRRRA